MTREPEPDSRIDRSLVTAFLGRGDEAAFRQLYRRHTPSIHLLARRLLGGDGAEDVVQDTWLRAAARLESFRWESSLRTWLCGIAVNRCRELLREQGGARVVTVTGTAPEAVSDRRSTPSPEQRCDLESAISQLPAGSRGVLVLHDVEGRSHVEIASLLGIDEGTSRSQLHKARRALRELLQAHVPLDAGGLRHEP